MRLMVYKKLFENLNTTRFLVFAGVTVMNLFLILIVLFYIIVGNSDVREDIPCESTLNYVSYDKSMVEDFSAWNNNCDWMLTVVNDKNKISPIYTKELKEFGGVDVDSRIVMDLEEMILDARNEANINLFVSSGYRTAESQERRLKKAMEENIQKGCSENDAIKLAELSVSKPEFSEHNLGLSVDFNGAKDDFTSTNEYVWLLENSYKYGFILRYSEDKMDITGKPFKPWHFRYVGEKNAKIMKEKNFCLEEYVSYIINFE